jgi:CubicO group peptidase (beta-lactamase class C family)
MKFPVEFVVHYLAKVIFIYGFQFSCFGQLDQEKVVHQFFKAYNANDFKEVKKLLFLPGRVFISNEQLKVTLAEPKKNWGNYYFDKIVSRKKNELIVQVRSSRDTTTTEHLYFKFNRSNKIKSFFIVDQHLLFGFRNDSLNIEINVAKIEELLLYKHKYGNFNGCVLVLNRNQVLFEKCYGVENFETNKPLDVTTKFYLASCTKMFTAIAIMKLIEEGKCKISDPVKSVFPNFPYSKITIKHLLTHTSGMIDYFNLIESDDSAKLYNNQEILNLYFKKPPKLNFKPGNDFEYANINYVILASVIEKLSSMNYVDFLSNKIFVPYGVEQIDINGILKNLNKVDFAKSYLFNPQQQKYNLYSDPNDEYLSKIDNIYGDGNLNLSIEDIKKWEIGMNENPLLTKHSVDSMYSNVKLSNGEYSNYGFGHMLPSNKEKQLNYVFHSGGWYGFHNMYLKFPDEQIGIIILTNNHYPSLTQLTQLIGNIILY